jgi:hypothetical protein
MSRQFIALSIPLENDIIPDPQPFTPTFIDNKTSINQLCAFFPGLAKEDLPYRESRAVEKALPPHGYTIACFTVKIRSASAGWTRAVAILEDEG